MNYFDNLYKSGKLSIAFETNGKGFLGYIVELPGAFVRGSTEDEALSKANAEADAYLIWLGHKGEYRFDFTVTQRYKSDLMIEDADSEILLDEDRGIISEEELRALNNLTFLSAETFLSLYQSAELKNWVDESRIRKTFYGENPKTVREIFDHVNRTQYYYLSRIKLRFSEEETDFLKIRRMCIFEIEKIYHETGNSITYYVDYESWTLKKVLRRFLWHDRIHAKAITRILKKQKEFNLINEFKDPFFFKNLL